MTSGAEQPKNSNDHWVPQFYLKRWTGLPDKKLSVFWFQGSRELHSRCSTKAVLSENHLYSVYGADGAFIHGEKQVFQDIDDRAAEPFRWLADREWRQMPAELTNPLYQFIHTLAPRSKNMRDYFIEHDERMQSETIGDLRSLGIADAEQIVGNIGQSARDRAALRILGIAAGDDSWRKFFDNIPVYIKDLGEADAEFFTSDAPLVSHPKIDDDNALHIFPVSPKKCLVASHDPSNVERFCGAPTAIFASVVNLRTLSRAKTAIARDERFRSDIFRFLGAEVNPDYCSQAVKHIFEGTLTIGVGEGVASQFRRVELDESGYRTLKEAFCAGIDGASWKGTRPYESSRPIGPCEQLILDTRDWSMQGCSYRGAYEIGRGLSYMFFQLDMWNQPLDVASELRKRLRHHQVHLVTGQRRSGSKVVYNLDALLMEFKRIAADALEQIYYNPDDHACEVWKYVERGVN